MKKAGLDYQMLFRKGACTAGLKLRAWLDMRIVLLVLANEIAANRSLPETMLQLIGTYCTYRPESESCGNQTEVRASSNVVLKFQLMRTCTSN